MTFSPVSVVFLLICFQSILFSLFLITNSGRKKLSNYLLAAFLLTLAGQMAALLFEFSEEDLKYVLPYMCIFGYAYGPLLYLYSVSLINKDFKWSPFFVLHFIPVVVFFLSALLGYPLCMKIGSLLYISLIVYIVLAILKMQKYRRVLKQTQSVSVPINLQWLQWTMIIFCIILLSDIVDRFIIDLDFIFGISIVHFALLFLVNWIFFKGLKHPQLFQGVTEEEKSLVMEKESDLSTETDFEEITNKLILLMEEQKPFTNPELSLNDLATLLNIPPRKLSRIINRHMGKNFVSFINSYRIEMARDRLANPKDPKETVLEVMYEVGFKSKSSFNTLFKEQTGKTPTAFKNAHLK